jgi:hypothetical protein
LMKLKGNVMPPEKASAGMVLHEHVMRRTLVAPPRSTVVMALNRESRNWISSLKKCSRANAARDVKNLLIVQSHSPFEHELRGLAARIIVHDSDDVSWVGIGAVVAITVPNAPDVADLETDHLAEVYMIWFEAGDAIGDHIAATPHWASVPRRKFYWVLRMLQEWAGCPRKGFG